jgi:predicted amidohydrolase YtcJ
VNASIKTGKKADFEMLAEKPLKADPIKMTDIKVLQTVSEGHPL